MRSCVADSIKRVKQFTAMHRSNMEHYVKLAYHEAMKPAITQVNSEYIVHVQQTTCVDESARARACMQQHGEKHCAAQMNDLGLCMYVATCAKQICKCLDKQAEGTAPNLYACLEKDEATKKCIAKL